MSTLIKNYSHILRCGILYIKVNRDYSTFYFDRQRDARSLLHRPVAELLQKTWRYQRFFGVCDVKRRLKKKKKR